MTDPDNETFSGPSAEFSAGSTAGRPPSEPVAPARTAVAADPAAPAALADQAAPADPADAPSDVPAPAVLGVPEVLELEVGPVAHGGWCVARNPADEGTGRVVFVRHALPGERIRAQVTEEGKKFLRADAIEILRASPDRVEAPCPFAGPGRCGGCDWQHATLPAQRRLKAAVIEEQLARLAGIQRSVVVEEVPMPVDLDGEEFGAPIPAGPGLGWRTRMQFAVDDDGAVGLRRHRSHSIEHIDECLIAHPGVEIMGIERKRWPGAAGVEAVASAATGDRLVVLSERRGRGRGGRPVRVPRLDVPVRLVRGKAEPGRTLPYVREAAAGRMWQVSGAGFWQIHPGAAQMLTDAVVTALDPRAGDIVLDLYCGVGLFAGALGERVGKDGLVVGIESSGQAVRDAKFNLRDLPQVAIEQGRVEDVIAQIEFGRRGTPVSTGARGAGGRQGRRGGSKQQGGRGQGGAQGRGGDYNRTPDERFRRADLVVLDPPRGGAGREIVDQLATMAGRKIAYVSCDPATLARDLGYFSERGWTLQDLRAFDAFPMTHHVESLAVLVKG